MTFFLLSLKKCPFTSFYYTTLLIVEQIANDKRNINNTFFTLLRQWERSTLVCRILHFWASFVLLPSTSDPVKTNSCIGTQELTYHAFKKPVRLDFKERKQDLCTPATLTLFQHAYFEALGEAARLTSLSAPLGYLALIRCWTAVFNVTFMKEQQ